MSAPTTLDKGFNYAFFSENTRAVSELIRTNLPGPTMVLTGTFPDKFTKIHKIPDAELRWLSNTQDPRTVRPGRLEFEVAKALHDFIRERDSGTIWIDGFETLILNNDFTTVVEFLKGISDNCSQRGFTLITSISPGLLDKQQKSSITSEFDLKFEF